jgi:hypothetical protein
VRFERRGIKVINLVSNKSNYGTVLSETFKELYEYWQDNVIPASHIKDEQLLRELSLPPQAPTRLCFFSLPISLSSFYRDKVFPIVKEYGFVPVTADEVVSPGDTVFPKIDALIKRSHLFIVDISTQYTLTELQLALKNIDVSRILIIAQRNIQQLPIEISNFRVLTRPDFFAPDPVEFLEDIRLWLSNAAANFESTSISEPRRLLNSGEYRAAVISSITLLESNLRKWLDIPSQPSLKPVTLRNMLDIAHQHELLGKYEVKTILEWLKIRNEVVHSDRKITKNVAENIVNGVLDIVIRMSR